jgi:sn-glycerol 3-phosphate transport system substrate-binding protein
MFLRLFIICACVFASVNARAATEIQWWHSMDGALNDWVNDLAKEFNASQSDYKVVPTYKGEYDTSMAAGIAAYRAGNAPDILQVFEVGTATMMYAKGAVKPVTEVMKEGGYPFDPKAYLPAVTGYYTAPNGELMSFPFNSSTTVFYYNKDAFSRVGLDAEKAPATWPEVVEAARKLKASGSACPFTTSWMTWAQLESFSTWHNVLYASQDNGFGGLDARLVFNSPLHVRHFETLASMSKDGLFVYKGRAGRALTAFTSGECAMFIGSSGSYASIKRDSKFAFAESTLPYYPDVPGAPQNTIVGGASLWVMAGKPAQNYKGVAAFFNFLSNPKVQAASHQRTGYLPITVAAYELTAQSGFYEKNPGTDIAVKQMTKATTNRSRGVRLGNFAIIRTILDEETEQVWAGKKTAKEALDTAVTRGNDVLAKFEAANK